MPNRTNDYDDNERTNDDTTIVSNDSTTSKKSKKECLNGLHRQLRRIALHSRYAACTTQNRELRKSQMSNTNINSVSLSLKW